MRACTRAAGKPLPEGASVARYATDLDTNTGPPSDVDAQDAGASTAGASRKQMQLATSIARQCMRCVDP